ncbi:ISL3 family transposase [Ruoffia sp. FAM 24228]|uniref:Mobile element protein n=7 Tax=Carnobacteriaceae TaxID=186828 RepID=A0A1R4K6Z9_9LACT|nr:ISL3 family transposase [Marinilactibacillus psychrotolerans]SJN40018.1 Mobile element protein [Marinilactibacillus psychrotolerans 42ea]
MTHSHIIRNSLNIKDENIIFDVNNYLCIEEKIKGVNYLVYQATLTYKPKACHHCGSVNENYSITKNGTKTSTIKLGNIMFKPALLRLKKQRYLCHECNRTFIAVTTLVNKYCFISNPIKNAIGFELAETQSMTCIAKRVSVSPTTVIRLLENSGKALEPSRFELPEHLSFDEFKSVKEAAGSMSFIFTNAQTHDIIDIVENRQQRELIAYFQRYPNELRQTVKTVTLDMYSPYLKVIHDCFPNAELIIDRFHIVQHINRALNRLRIEIMKTVRYTRPRDYSKLKKQWKIILKNVWDVDFETYGTHRLYDGLVTEKMMVNYLLSIDNQFQWVYDLINDLKWALDAGDYEGFVAQLERSKERPVKRYVRTTFQTLNKYLGSIENSCKYTLSNGHLEGINNKIKTIKRSGYGYRNFSHLRARILISFKLKEKTEKEIRPLTFEEEKVINKQLNTKVA